jgi:hypothetical protein
MTDRREPAELPVDLLADLDAGALDPARAAVVRAAAAGDPQAAAVLAALDATRAELGALADPPVPARYAARWESALAAEAARTVTPLESGSDPASAPAEAERPQLHPGGDIGAPAPLPSTSQRFDPDPQPPTAPSGGRLPRLRPSSGRRRRTAIPRRRVRPAIVAGAVLAAAVVAGVVRAPQEPAPLSLDGVDLAAAGLAVQGDFDVGDLADPARRAGCLRTVESPGVSPDAPLLGGREVVVDGRDGVLLLLASGRLGRLQVVVVEPGCGPEGGVLLGTQTIEA